MTRNGTLPAMLEGRNGTTGAGVLPARTEATFTAQLLAMSLDSPSFRRRRRVEPALGAAAYRERLGCFAPSLARTTIRA